MNEISLNTCIEDSGKRIDVFLSEKIESMTRNAAQIALNSGNVTCNGKCLKKNYKIGGAETVVVTLPETKQIDLVPQNLPIDIVFEDEDIIVVNKARGMVVHPAVGNWDGTLVNALMFHCGDRLSGINGEIRPGIVHRIDKDTSGLLVVAKNDIAHQSLAAQIQAHEVIREYEAIVCGVVKEEKGIINKPIGRHKTDRKRMAVVADGREAITHYAVLERFSGYSYMQFHLETGRTHQIRVHMAAIGHPIIGDPIYGHKKDKYSNLSGQCLHARKLTLKHPRTGKVMEFYASRPQYFDDVLQKLQKTML